MKNIYVNWLKKEVIEKCQIKRGEEKDKSLLGTCYQTIFNGSPFYESWTKEEADSVIENYLKNEVNLLVPMIEQEPIGFLVSTKEVPADQQEFMTYPKELIQYVEEIGILPAYREQNIASELVRKDLIHALLLGKEYIAYRTNMIRYFKKESQESFETAAERTIEEDKKARKNQDEIIVPKLSVAEKQDFVNQYIPLIQRREDLDNSNSNRLFRKIFGQLDFCQNGYNYTWQKDPTGENNDRIFPLIDLKKNGYVKTRFGQGGVR